MGWSRTGLLPPGGGVLLLSICTVDPGCRKARVGWRELSDVWHRRGSAATVPLWGRGSTGLGSAWVPAEVPAVVPAVVPRSKHSCATVGPACLLANRRPSPCRGDRGGRGDTSDRGDRGDKGVRLWLWLWRHQDGAFSVRSHAASQGRPPCGPVCVEHRAAQPSVREGLLETTAPASTRGCPRPPQGFGQPRPIGRLVACGWHADVIILLPLGPAWSYIPYYYRTTTILLPYCYFSTWVWTARTAGRTWLSRYETESVRSSRGPCAGGGAAPRTRSCS